MEEKENERIMELFESMYEAEGYYLAASANIQIPWFQCTFRCRCMEKQPLSGIDKVICKCIKCGINTVKDISFVLALAPEIISGIVEELVEAGMFSIDNRIISLSGSGEKSFANHSRNEVLSQDIRVHMNGITGEWSTEENGLKSAINITDSSIKLHPIRSVIKLDIENDDNIKLALQELYHTHIVSAFLLDYKTLTYKEEKIFFYKNKKKKIIFSIYDYEKKEIDIRLGAALLDKYERKELLEIMQAEKYILENDALVDRYEGKVRELKYYRNKEIRELFKNIFDVAEKSIFIISPWIDNDKYVMTEELMDKIERALSLRKIKIFIGYGYFSKEKMEKKRLEYSHSKNQVKKSKDREWQTELMAGKLKKRFGKYKNFGIFYVGTHEKLLCYDDRYTLIGSYNLLSYDGGERSGYGGFSFRREGAVMIDDVDFAEYVKREFRGESGDQGFY